MEKLKNRLHNGTCEELEKKKKIHKNKSLDLQQSKASLSIDLKNEQGFHLCVSKKIRYCSSGMASLFFKFLNDFGPNISYFFHFS